MIKKLNHAKHNEQACDYLSKSDYRDWIVTTAFYSALHYIEFQIFPITEEKSEYKSFSSYYSGVLLPHALEKEMDINKHEALIDLVKSKLPEEVFINYKFLYDICMNARYNSYRISRTLSNKARICLSDIKKHLTKVD